MPRRVSPVASGGPPSLRTVTLPIQLTQQIGLKGEVRGITQVAPEPDNGFVAAGPLAGSPHEKLAASLRRQPKTCSNDVCMRACQL